MSDSMELGFCSDGTVNPALGILGGHAAAAARQWLQGDDGEVVNMRTAEQIVVRKDQLVVSYSNGGGGYGDPSHRLPEKVAKDVREGWISKERAREVYKVSCNSEGKIDTENTALLREG
jgi:N-methylhydantoinase B